MSANECVHYRQFFQGKPLPCAACSKTSWHRVYDRESGAGPFSFRASAPPSTRPQLDVEIAPRGYIVGAGAHFPSDEQEQPE